MGSAVSLKSLVQKARCRPVVTGLILVLLALGIYGFRAVTYSLSLGDARAALAEGNYEQARSLLTRCLERNPDDAEALLLSARLARRLGSQQSYEQAERHLRTYESAHGRDPQFNFEKTLLRAQTQNPSLEDDRYLRRELEPDHSDYPGKSNDVFTALTLGYRRAEQATATLHCARELLELDPDHVRGLLARGWALEHFNRMDEALADYRRAAQLDPANEEARLSLGEMLLNFNRPAEAVGHFEWLRRKQLTDPRYGYGLARCRVALDDLDDAARILDELLERYDTQPLFLELRGHVAWRQDNSADAVRFLQEAVERAPYLRQANYELSQCLRRQGQTAEAGKYQDQVARIDADTERLGELTKVLSGPARTAAHCLEAAIIALRLGKEVDAVRWLEAALLLDPTLPGAHALMADIYERHGDRRNAELHRQRAQRK